MQEMCKLFERHTWFHLIRQCTRRSMHGREGCPTSSQHVIRQQIKLRIDWVPYSSMQSSHSCVVLLSVFPFHLSINVCTILPRKGEADWSSLLTILGDNDGEFRQRVVHVARHNWHVVCRRHISIRVNFMALMKQQRLVQMGFDVNVRTAVRKTSEGLVLL